MKKILKKYNWKVTFCWCLAVTFLFVVINIFGIFIEQQYAVYGEIFPFISFVLMLILGILAGFYDVKNNDFINNFPIVRNPFPTLLMLILFFHIAVSLLWTIFDPIENVSFIGNLLRIFVFFSPFSLSIIAIPFFIGYIPAISVKFASKCLRK